MTIALATGGNSTYDVSDGTLTMTPIVAKNPSVMSATATRPSTSFTIAGNTLTLVLKSPETKVETRMVLTRVE